MRTTLINLASVLLAGGMIALLLYMFVLQDSQSAFGSVSVSDEYYSTTTVAAGTATARLIKTGNGSIAQVTITGTSTGNFQLYNATTTNVSNRTLNKATSTILIADFSAQATAGTYTFDSVFTDGLLLVQSAAPATSTITYR